MYVILQLQHSVGDVSNSTSSTVQSLTELVVFFFLVSSYFLFHQCGTCCIGSHTVCCTLVKNDF